MEQLTYRGQESFLPDVCERGVKEEGGIPYL